MVIGVGGGSNLDCAKGINILRYNPAPLAQYADAAKPFDPGHELIMVPTTSGTGSEVSDGAILSDENHIKRTFLAPSTFAEYVVLDYDLLVGMPPFLTASTGLDALAHACEGMTGNQSTPFLELFGQQVIRDIIQYLPRAVRDGHDIEARKKLAVASNVAGFMLIYGHAIAGHSIAQTLGAYFDIPHGAACGYTLPYIIEYNAASTPRLTRMVGEAMGLAFPENATAQEIGTAIRVFLVDFVYNQCKMPKLQEKYPYDESKFQEIAEISANELMQNFNPQKLTAQDCLTIIRRMYELTTE
jgi:alcohol dehydrogenase